MSSTKHELKRNEILEAAFRIWGASRYRNTSLSELAGHLNLTKQAIYRYFSSKEKLENEMEKRVYSIYLEFAENLLSTIQTLKNDELIRCYIEGVLHFLRENAHYLGFLPHRNRNSTAEVQISGEYTRRFSALMLQNAGMSAVALRYLDTLICQQMHREMVSGAEDGEAVPNLLRIWNTGFCPQDTMALPDYNRVFGDASRVDYRAFEGDGLVKAVFEAVMEEAGSSVSLGRVARKAGLTKSSLYNYWPSKEAMLSDVFQKQTRIYSGLFSDFVKKYSDPSDILFAYLVFAGTFLRRNPSTLKYLQRMMSFGVEFPKDGVYLNGDFLSEIKALVDSQYINTGTLKSEDFLSLINFACLMEMKYHLTENSVRIRIEEGVKELHQLIVGGFRTSRRIK